MVNAKLSASRVAGAAFLFLPPVAVAVALLRADDAVHRHLTLRGTALIGHLHGRLRRCTPRHPPYIYGANQCRLEWQLAAA